MFWELYDLSHIFQRGSTATREQNDSTGTI